MNKNKKVSISECLTEEQSNFLKRVRAIDNSVLKNEINKVHLIFYLMKTYHIFESWILGNPIFKKELYSIICKDDNLVNFYVTLGEKHEFDDVIFHLTGIADLRSWIPEKETTRSILS